MSELPKIIQGGMGAGVSGWQLANAVARAGQLGVVSGTALDTILTRRLQLGDPDGAMRRGLAALPIAGVAERILERYFIPGGKPAEAPFRGKPILTEQPSGVLDELTVAANFVEVWLAREGHDRPVGINYLEKIQLPTLPSLFGAMLAGVGYVCMGAGLPVAIPGILDRLAQGLPAELRLDVTGARPDDGHAVRFDPAEWLGAAAPPLTRPRFLAIVATEVVANVLLRRSEGAVFGFVVENATAGGHNAPPRGRSALNEQGEPVYGPKDVADLAAFRAFGKPFWLAGSHAEPERLARALAEGAAGIQVGTAFAFADESGITPEWRREVLRRSRQGNLRVFTDPVASPTGFPFKVLQLENTMAKPGSEDERQRRCDLGYLRHAYRRADGSVGWRCPGEASADYAAKGGDPAATIGRKCLCNALVANVGLAQVRQDGAVELPLFTAGDDALGVARFCQPDRDSYSAADVIDYLLAGASNGCAV